MGKRRRRSSRPPPTTPIKADAGSQWPQNVYISLSHQAKAPNVWPSAKPSAAEKPNSLRDRVGHAIRRWWKMASAFALAFAMLAGILNMHQAYDWLVVTLHPEEQVATKRDAAKLNKRLDKIEGLLTLRVGANEISGETEAAIQRFLAENSPDRQSALDHLREKDLNGTINALTALAGKKISVSKQSSVSAADDLYLAGLIAGRLNYDQAIALLSRARDLEPEKPRIRAMLALFYLNRGDASGATREIAPVMNRNDLSAGDAITVQNVVGLITLDQGDLPTAEQAFRQTLAGAKALNDPAGEAAALGNLGLVYAHQGKGELAKTYFHLSIAVNKGTNPALDGNQYCNLGREYVRQRKMSEAEESYNAALDIFTYAKDKTCLPSTLIGLGIVREDRGDYRGAANYYARARDEADRAGDLTNQIFARLDLAQTLAQLRDRGEWWAYNSALLIALSQPSNSDVFYRHNYVLNRIIDASRETKDFGGLQAALSSLERLIATIPPDDLMRVWATNSDAALVSCALGDNAKFSHFSQVAGKAMFVDRPDGKTEYRLPLDEFVDQVDAVAKIEIQFNRTCLGPPHRS